MKPERTVRKAVFPVAGLGTRFLPATKAIPKEMLPVVDRPLIQHAVDEALEAGIEHLILVNRGDKPSILAHFERAPDLENRLLSAGNQTLLERIRDMTPAGVRMEVAIQEQALGLGHAVLCARDQIDDDEAFAVILPDDMVRNPAQGALAQLLDLYGRTGASVIGVEAIDPGLTGSYGIAAVEVDDAGDQRITQLVEKPAPEVAPSNLGVVGRYVLDANIFRYLSDQGSGAGGEIQLTDAIARMMADRPVLAHILVGQRYDCGSRLGMLKANIDYALDEADMKDDLLAHMSARLRQEGL